MLMGVDEDENKIMRLDEREREVMSKLEKMLDFDVNCTKKDIKIVLMSFDNTVISTFIDCLWTRPDSNWRPPTCEAGALPTELRAQTLTKNILALLAKIASVFNDEAMSGGCWVCCL